MAMHQPPHPGVFIRETNMEPFGLSCRFLAEKLGVGTALLKSARQYVQEVGCYKVALMTGSKKIRTLELYEKAEFTGNKIGCQRRFNA
jgi:GNAT superfamily N-acetyltransferase